MNGDDEKTIAFDNFVSRFFAKIKTVACLFISEKTR